MENDLFATLITFTYPHESSVLRGRLESEGIECFIKDELTTQVNPFYSNALGGVRLQVRQSDMPMAMAILKDSGYLDMVQKPMSPFYVKLEKLTKNWTFINTLRPEYRLILILSFSLIVILSIFFFSTLPD